MGRIRPHRRNQHLDHLKEKLTWTDAQRLPTLLGSGNTCWRLVSNRTWTRVCTMCLNWWLLLHFISKTNVVLLTPLYFYEGSHYVSIALKSTGEFCYLKCEGLYAVFITGEKPVTVNGSSYTCRSGSECSLHLLNRSVWTVMLLCCNGYQRCCMKCLLRLTPTNFHLRVRSVNISLQINVIESSVLVKAAGFML